MEEYDLIIIGAGPAGLTAGLYAVRSGLKVALVSKDIGGTANYIFTIENWPGFEGSGPDLMKQFYGQLKKYDVDFIMDDVREIKKKDKEFIIKTGDKGKEILSKSIIIATGTERKKLNIKDEKELTGKGVSYCTTCDAFFFKKKIVAVIGGSDCAANSALTLSDIAQKVYVIYRGEKLGCEDINSKRLEKKKNVEIIYNTVPKEVIGDKKMEKVVGLKIDRNGKIQSVNVDGIFVEIGAEPLTKFAKNLGLKVDADNYLVVDKNMKTNVPGIFAVGDITNHKLKQVIVASSQGAIAAKSAYDYLKKREK